MASTLADQLLQHVLSFSLKGVKLPSDVGVLDPFNGPNAEEVRRIVTAFHRKYYSDNKTRVLMLGINPGRLGAGSTGLSFTDTKRCESDLGIPVQGLRTHEPSSDFFYRMIRAAGVDLFDGHGPCVLWFASGLPGLGCPLGTPQMSSGPIASAVMIVTFVARSVDLGKSRAFSIEGHEPRASFRQRSFPQYPCSSVCIRG